MIGTDQTKAIVNPVRTTRSPVLPSATIMVGTRLDLQILCQLLDFDYNNYRSLYMSRLYLDSHGSCPVALAGPLVGAPYAAMILESLIAWGAAKIVYFGWCGAISTNINVGDVLLPTKAVIDEGTTRHYFEDNRQTADPSEALTAVIRNGLLGRRIEFQEGCIWTTDGIFRETVAKVVKHQSNGVLGVEMELSALFSVGAYRKVDVGGLLVVSDDLSNLVWRPGFKDERFKKGRQMVSGFLKQLAAGLGKKDE